MSLEGVLEEIRARLEESIKRQLSGMQGFVLKPLYNSTMPLHVELSLAPEVFELLFHEDGIVKLSHGYSSNVDVRIETDTSGRAARSARRPPCSSSILRTSTLDKNQQNPS